MQFSLEVVRQFARLLQQSGLQELSLQDIDDATGKPFRVVVKKGQAPFATRTATTQATAQAPSLAPSNNVAASEDELDDLSTLEATMPQVVIVAANAVGLLRATTPALGVGDAVRAGQTVAIVESMKIPGEIAAPIAGIINEIRAEEGQGVEYGQPLLAILPSAA